MVGFMVLVIAHCNFANVIHCGTVCIIKEYRQKGLVDEYSRQVKSEDKIITEREGRQIRVSCSDRKKKKEQ